MKVRIKYRDLVTALEGAANNTDTDDRWIAARVLRKYRGWEDYADLAVEVGIVAEMVDALKYYASEEAWSVSAIEGPCGDYGNKARAILSKLTSGEATND